jgi:Cd2+/Zn2+-exporting ATPase
LDIFTSQIFVAELLFLAVVAISGYESIKKGLISLLKGKFSINLLITIALQEHFSLDMGKKEPQLYFIICR